MKKHTNPRSTAIGWLCISILLATCTSTGDNKPQSGGKKKYDDLVALYKDFRRLIEPKLVDSIPDYTAPTMAKAYDTLKTLLADWKGMDTTGWTIDQRVDYKLVGAQLNGEDFNHRIMKRWSSDPAFYNTLGWFNPTMEGAISLPRQLPMDSTRLQRFKKSLEKLPKQLAQAKTNLTNMKPDLAILGIKLKEYELKRWERWKPDAIASHPELQPQIDQLIASLKDFKAFLEEKKPSLTGSSGIGKENYDWMLKNVYLLPLTTDQCIMLTQRELERTVATLKLEEHRNRNLPELKLIDNEQEFKALQVAGQEKLIKFVRDNKILPEPDLLTTKPVGRYVRTNGERNFFEQVLDRDPTALHPHDMTGHAPDGLRVPEWNKRPIPRGYDPEYVTGMRAEGMATGMEDLLMQLGMHDESPRSRELAYMLRAFRAVRALADMKMHANMLDLTGAMDYAKKTVPYGWYGEEGNYLIWEEMDLYMRQPGYGIGYFFGAYQIEQLIAEKGMEQGKNFNIQSFMKDFINEGLVPISLIRFKMTGKEE
jgi:hypothetical protein